MKKKLKNKNKNNNTVIVNDNSEEQLPQLAELAYFPSMVYTMMREEFLDVVLNVANEYVTKAKQSRELDEVYPVYQSDNFSNDERIQDFVRFISQVAWDILQRQGYAMEQYTTITHELWCQDHYKYSGMDKHIHGAGCQISGFYFLQCPENSPRIILHDPRSAKIYADIPEQNVCQATVASQAINFTPRPGQLMFINSWLPHSFGKNPSEETFRFIHFNISLGYNLDYQPPAITEATVI